MHEPSSEEAPDREGLHTSRATTATDVLERLDRLAARYSRKRPGMIVTRSHVMRTLLLRALEDEERHGKA